MLAAIGGDWGAEDRVGLGRFRHYIIGARNRRLGWWVRRRVHGWRGLPLGPGLAVLLQLLQFPHAGGKGTLQAHALDGNPVKQRELFFQRQVGFVDASLTHGIAREQPLRGSHLFQIMPLAVSLRLPLGIQRVPELLIIRGVVECR